MDGSFSAKCQSFVDLVTTRVRRQRKGTKCTKRFKPEKVTYFCLYIFCSCANQISISLDCGELCRHFWESDGTLIVCSSLRLIISANSNLRGKKIREMWSDGVKFNFNRGTKFHVPYSLSIYIRGTFGYVSHSWR